MKLGMRHKLLLGAAILAAVGSGTIAAGLWDEFDAMGMLPPRPAHDAPAHHGASLAGSPEYQARLVALQMSSTSFFELWRLHAR